MSVSVATIEKSEMPAGEGVSGLRSIPPLAFWTISALGAIAGGYYLKQVIDAPWLMMHLKDLSVYQIAGDRVHNGTSVYDTPLLGNTRGVWEYVYTPFAALLFVPLIALRGDLFTYLGGLGNVAMLAASAWAALSLLGYRRDARLVLVSLPIAGLLLWCEPVRGTMAFGQINICLLLLVLADMALPDSSRWKGVLTGIAAGIKLTPAFFVLYLLVTGRYRAAGMAIGAFFATVLVGLAVLPKDSWTFWSGAFLDPARVGIPENPQNETLRGLLARVIGVDGAHQLLWLAMAVTIAAICLALARRLSLTGHELPAVVLCGLTTTAVSPFSWIHHWVWLAPLMIYLTHLTLRRKNIATMSGLLVAFVVASGGILAFYNPTLVNILDYPMHGYLGVTLHYSYLWLTLALFATTALYLQRSKPPKDCRSIAGSELVADLRR